MSPSSSKSRSFRRGKRGPVVPVPQGKTRITTRVDTDVLDWFKEQVHEAGGGSYQNLMNRALRQYMESGGEALEDKLRRVIREEAPQLRRVK